MIAVPAAVAPKGTTTAAEATIEFAEAPLRNNRIRPVLPAVELQVGRVTVRFEVVSIIL